MNRRTRNARSWACAITAFALTLTVTACSGSSKGGAEQWVGYDRSHRRRVRARR